MSEDNKKMMDWLNAELSKRGHKNFRWTKPEGVLPHIIRNAVFHDVTWSAGTPLTLRDGVGKAVTIHPAVERDEAMPIRPVGGATEEDDIEEEDDTEEDNTEEDDTLRASGTVTFRPAKSAKSPVHFYSSGADDDHSEKCGGSPPQRIELPPGYVMERVTRCLFFFALTRPREFEEIVGDYEYNMIEAEAKGATAGALWLLRLKYWGAYFYTLAVRLPAGIVGKIIRTLTGG